MPEQTPLRLSFRQAPSGVDFAARVAEIAAFPAQTLLVATGDGPVRLEVEEAMVSIPEAEPGPGGRLVFDIERREGRNRVVEIKLIEPSGERAVLRGVDAPLGRVQAWLEEAAAHPRRAEMPDGWFRGRDL
ncbi:MAG: hypothetical protein ACU0DT_08190 [Albimonas sp.]|uniref:hypothetical protein n=1 Tax=Albimonas sp. TaxID=1872425 RepID=UPI004057978E